VADQEFLASFAVEIDEAGVARLQKILADNKGLADNVSAAFQAAAKAMKEFAGTWRAISPRISGKHPG